MIHVPSGKFKMGSCIKSQEERAEAFVGASAICSKEDGWAESNELPQREVEVRSFLIGQTEVTLGQFKEFIKSTKRFDIVEQAFRHFNGQGDNAPVNYISFEEVMLFIDWLNQYDGGGWRLPSEAEWEYACKAGTENRFCTSAGDLNEGGWFLRNSKGDQKGVGKKSPNHWGIYDMSGNVSEMVMDCWTNNYKGAPSDGSPRMDGNCNLRVIRGGNSELQAEYSRSASRNYVHIKSAKHLFGFRLAKDIGGFKDEVQQR